MNTSPNPPAHSGPDSDYASLSALNSHFNNRQLGTNPFVVTQTSTNGKTSLDFSNNGYGSGEPFNVAGATTGDFGFNSNATYFETMFTGVINIANSGSYTFSTTSDDGSVLFIDGNSTPLVNNNNYQGATLASGTTTLAAGPHQITIGFFDGGGGRGLLAQYSGPDTGNATVTIPNSVLNVLSSTQTYSNAVVVGGATGYIDVSGSLDASIGSLSIGAGQVLAVSASADNTESPYTLTATGGTTITGPGGPAIFDVTNSVSNGVGTLRLGAVSGGTNSIVKVGNGVLSLTAAGNYSGGTTIGLTSQTALGTGTVAVTNVTGSNPLGTGAVTFAVAGGKLALRGQVNQGQSGLQAYYYNNGPDTANYVSLSALTSHLNSLSQVTTAPTSTNGQTNLDFSNGGYGAGAPFGNQGMEAVDNIEAYMTGVINITKGGDYSFTTTSDDGNVLWIDNNNTPLINSDYAQGATTRTSTVALRPGSIASPSGISKRVAARACSCNTTARTRTMS